MERDECKLVQHRRFEQLLKFSGCPGMEDSHATGQSRDLKLIFVQILRCFFLALNNLEGLIVF